MKKHDVLPGALAYCQLSGSPELFTAMDLGHQAPCDALLDSSDRQHSEMTYPLRLNICPGSGSAQLSYIVPGEIIYPPSYPYRAGISKPLVDYQREFATALLDEFCPQPDTRRRPFFVLDIGSNDGTLLLNFQEMGCQVLGVEPTNIALIGCRAGVPMMQEFFTRKTANNVKLSFGRPQLVTMSNVFAHMSSLGEVMDGLSLLVRDETVFVSESHYLLDVLQKNQFDTIYHEHVRTYSLRALCLLMELYGMEVFDVQRASRYGGNIRIYAAQAGMRKISSAVALVLEEEDAAGLFDEDSWVRFRSRVNQQRDGLMEFLYRAHRTGMPVAGYSAPGRASTLLNYYGIDPVLLPWIAETEGSLKIGKFYPGCHIPIVPSSHIQDENPKALVVLAWHYSEFIEERLRREGFKGKILLPLPEFKVLERP